MRRRRIPEGQAELAFPAEIPPPKFYGLGGECQLCNKRSATARMFQAFGPNQKHPGMIEVTLFACESCASKHPTFAHLFNEQP